MSTKIITTAEAYIAAHPERRVTINACLLPEEGAGVEVTFEELRGPYRPLLLGIYKEPSFAECVAKMDLADKLKAKAAK